MFNTAEVDASRYKTNQFSSVNSSMNQSLLKESMHSPKIKRGGHAASTRNFGKRSASYST